MPENQWAIRPRTMDAGRLNELHNKIVEVCAAATSDTPPTVSAIETHAVLCHLESVEKAMQEYAKTVGEAAAKHREAIDTLKTEHAGELTLMGNALADSDVTIKRLTEETENATRRISELQGRITRASAAAAASGRAPI